MAIAIREYLGSEGLDVEWNVSDAGRQESLQISESSSVTDDISEDAILVDIEGIHVGPTRNYTWYTEGALRGSVPTWTKPYHRPLIMHHNEKEW